MKLFAGRPRAPFGRRHSSAEPRRSSLEIQNLTFTDDDGQQLFVDANLRLAPGSKTCLVGSTGQDQAAMLALMLGLYRPERGFILVDDCDVASLSLQSNRNAVALVLRDPWLREGTLADNIAFGHPGVSKSDVEVVGDLIGLDDLVDGLARGYETVLIGRTGRQNLRLSAGQRRRIALARALVRNPGVLLFEEPTTDLGTDDERQMIRAIDVASHGRTTVMATHRLNLARRCDTVQVIEDGKIVPYDCGDKATHAKLWDLQVPPLVTSRSFTSSGRSFVQSPATSRGARRSHLRLVKPNDPPIPEPTTSPWGVSIGSELAPGYLASGLLSRTLHIETWVAWSIDREEPVRIKFPRHSPVTYQGFEQLFREYKTLKSCNHPGLTATHGADLDAELPYTIHEYLDSNSLATVVRRRNHGMDALDVLCAGFELAGAVSYLHQRGFVHLNLRASNVRTREDTIVITDFSDVMPIGAELPQAPTPGSKTRRTKNRFLAPEYRPGRAADPKMDVFALGALMHRATAGALVTSASVGGSGSTPHRSLAPYRSLAGDAPGAMPDIIDAMLSPDPAMRPDAEHVLSEFRRILPSSLVRPRVSTAAARSARMRLVGVNN